MASVLIIDDDSILCEMFSRMVRGLGHEATIAFTMKDGLDKVTSGTYDVVLLDVQMPDGNGLKVLPEIRMAASSPEVIIITGLGEPDGAELAIKNGAWDYIEKASSLDSMRLPLLRALQYREEKHSKRPPLVLKREGIVGESPQIHACLDIVAQAAGSNANTLITGETGTGKELFAWAIHRNSYRRNGKFIVVDCATLPETLVESTLFGHEKGAFTGAMQARDGLIKQAHEGTLFLDEVGELPLSSQKAFLRVLQEHRFRPVGSKQEIESDFRLVAATNRNLNKMVENGQFREDLLYRLQSIIIRLPALREHFDDIRELSMHHIDRLCRYYKLETKGISPDFFDALAAYSWPGNVRELVNVLESVISVAQYDPTLFACHLPTHIRVKAARSALSGSRVVPASNGSNGPVSIGSIYDTEEFPTLQAFRESMDRDYLKKLVSATGRDIEKSCDVSGVSRARLYQLLKKYGL